MNFSIEPKVLAAHVLVALARAQRARRLVTAQDVATELDVRKSDVRAIVTRLHHEGHVDALRMHLTLSGMALACALAKKELRELRTAVVTDIAAA